MLPNMNAEDMEKLLAEYPELSAEALKAADEHAGIIVLISGRDEDGVTPFWAFMDILPSKYIGFRKAQATGESFFLDDYGDILITGKGKEPPEDVVQEMREEYGFDPDFEEKAVEMFKKLPANMLNEKKKALLEKIKNKKYEGDGE